MPDFSRFKVCFLHHFVSAKLATSSTRVDDNQHDWLFMVKFLRQCVLSRRERVNVNNTTNGSMNIAHNMSLPTIIVPYGHCDIIHFIIKIIYVKYIIKNQYREVRVVHSMVTSEIKWSAPRGAHTALDYVDLVL